MYKALYLSPMIPSFNLEGTADFFKDILNFSPVLDTQTYMILQKDNLTIHLLRAGQNIGQMEFYLEVDKIDELWETISSKVEGLKVRAPFDRDYKMREIHIAVPHTNTLLFIGQEIN
jgi:hypothetical protein